MVWLINFKGKTAKKLTVHKFKSEKWCINVDTNTGLQNKMETRL